MIAHQLASNQIVSHIEREAGGRGYIYLVSDVVGRRALVMAQKLPDIVSYLREHEVDDCKTSSLYDACIRQGQLYKNRFKVKKMNIHDCLDTIDRERRSQAFDTEVVVGRPGCYRVMMPAKKVCR